MHVTDGMTAPVYLGGDPTWGLRSGYGDPLGGAARFQRLALDPRLVTPGFSSGVDPRNQIPTGFRSPEVGWWSGQAGPVTWSVGPAESGPSHGARAWGVEGEDEGIHLNVGPAAIFGTMAAMGGLTPDTVADNVKMGAIARNIHSLKAPPKAAQSAAQVSARLPWMDALVNWVKGVPGAKTAGHWLGRGKVFFQRFAVPIALVMDAIDVGFSVRADRQRGDGTATNTFAAIGRALGGWGVVGGAAALGAVAGGTIALPGIVLAGLMLGGVIAGAWLGEKVMGWFGKTGVGQELGRMIAGEPKSDPIGWPRVGG